MSLVPLVHQDLDLARVLRQLKVAAVELLHPLVVLQLLPLLVLQAPLYHPHLVVLPLHPLLVLQVPLCALPWPQAPVLPREQSPTE